MEFLHEYSLLVAVALPVAVVVIINILLALTGESGTLLLPSIRGYPVSRDLPLIEATPEAPAPEFAEVPAESEEYRKAA